MFSKESTKSNQIRYDCSTVIIVIYVSTLRDSAPACQVEPRCQSFLCTIGQKIRGFDGVLYNLWPLLTPWVAASRIVAASARLMLKGVAGHWLVQHTAPVRAKPDGRPRLEGTHYKYPTSCSLPMYPSSNLHIMHTLAYTSPWATAQDHYEVSELRSRVVRTSARNNKRTNEPKNHYSYECIVIINMTNKNPHTIKGSQFSTLCFKKQTSHL